MGLQEIANPSERSCPSGSRQSRTPVSPHRGSRPLLVEIQRCRPDSLGTPPRVVLIEPLAMVLAVLEAHCASAVRHDVYLNVRRIAHPGAGRPRRRRRSVSSLANRRCPPMRSIRRSVALGAVRPVAQRAHGSRRRQARFARPSFRKTPPRRQRRARPGADTGPQPLALAAELRRRKDPGRADRPPRED